MQFKAVVIFLGPVHIIVFCRADAIRFVGIVVMLSHCLIPNGYVTVRDIIFCARTVGAAVRAKLNVHGVGSVGSGNCATKQSRFMKKRCVLHTIFSTDEYNRTAVGLTAVEVATSIVQNKI